MFQVQVGKAVVGKMHSANEQVYHPQDLVVIKSKTSASETCKAGHRAHDNGTWVAVEALVKQQGHEMMLEACVIALVEGVKQWVLYTNRENERAGSQRRNVSS